MTFWRQRGRPALWDALETVCEQIDQDFEAELQERDQRHAALAEEVDRLRARLAAADRIEQENRALRAELSRCREGRSRGDDDARPPSRSSSIPTGHARGRERTAPETGDPPARVPLGEISANKTPARQPGQGPLDPGGTAKSQTTSATSASDAGHDHGHGHDHDHDHDVAAAAKLAAKYRSLKQAFDVLTDRARKFREDRDGWLRYAESLEAKVQHLESRNRALLGASTGSPAAASAANSAAETALRPGSGEAPAPNRAPSRRQPPSRGGAGVVAALGPEPRASVSFSGPATTSCEDAQPRRRARSAPRDVPSSSQAPSSAQTDATRSEGDATPVASVAANPPQLPPDARPSSSPSPPAVTVKQVTIKQEPSSDEPVFVSERSVRKRRAADGAGSPSPPARRIKCEHESSDEQLAAGERPRFSPHESLDLDGNQHARAITPEKRRAAEEHHMPPSPALPPRSTGERQTTSRSALVARAPAPPPDLATPTEKPTRRPRPAETTPMPLCPDPDDHVRALAESEDDASCEDRRRRGGTASAGRPAARTGRLAQLLERPPAEPPAVLRASRPARRTEPAGRLEIDVPTRELPFGREERKGVHGTPQTAATAHTAEKGHPTPARPRDAHRTSTPSSAATGRRENVPSSHGTESLASTALRRRPLASLGLDDFKINPRFSGGRSFAFSEVVRSRAERAELPGCTDAQCCGRHFRAMAEAEMEAAGPALTTRAADIRLLEDYLGAQAHRLGRMSRAERRALWLEARVRELANRHGRHRQRFARRASPPGFWNADFPSTQEMQRERAEGEQRERQRVEERWREAMRGGGRWLFRDE